MIPSQPQNNPSPDQNKPTGDQPLTEAQKVAKAAADKASSQTGTKS